MAYMATYPLLKLAQVLPMYCFVVSKYTCMCSPYNPSLRKNVNVKVTPTPFKSTVSFQAITDRKIQTAKHLSAYIYKIKIAQF